MKKRKAAKRTRIDERVRTEHVRIQRLMRHLRDIRAEFNEVHVIGVAALKAKDYAALGDAILRENRLIERHRMLIERQRILVEDRLAHYEAPKRPMR